ncbi:WD repeat-containing protein 25-like [Achlya hypogyna]|uniref:WD repeat-containing protein 25-like n=1 Tax=Achlya hypogyna TaxID=1202772 RepID=A0A1V9ZTW3_ACHHY|nr:WD repeat-containing protein 25-like [Achlya hypogyna]
MDLIQGYASSDDEAPPPLKRKARALDDHVVELPPPLASAYKPKRRASSGAAPTTAAPQPLPPVFTDARAEPWLVAAPVPSRELRRWKTEYRVNRVRWNPQFPWLLASAGMHPTIDVWDAGCGTCARSLDQPHTAAVKDLQWSCDGRRLVSASFDRTVGCVDVETGTVVATHSGDHRFTAVAIHPTDANVVLVGDANGSILSWDLRGSSIRAFGRSCGEVLALAFLPGTDHLQFISSSTVTKTSAVEKAVLVWDYESGATVSKPIYGEGYSCSAVAVPTFSFPNAPNGRVHRSVPFVALQTHGNYIATVSAIKFQQLKARFTGHTAEGYGIDCAFNATGGLLATGDATGRLLVFDARRRHCVYTVSPHTHVCMAVQCHPAAPSVIATGGWDQSITIHA